VRVTCVTENAIEKFLEERVVGEERAAIEGHLVNCESCRAVAQELCDGELTLPNPPHGSTVPPADKATVVGKAARSSPPRMDSQTSNDFEPGDLIAGKYRFEKMVGKGGMGVVVAATNLDLEQLVALKFMHPVFMENKTSVARFKREARAAARLKSEHVGRVLDLGTLDSGEPYIVMEYLEGVGLGRVIRDAGRLETSRAVTMMMQICSGVGAAHAAGIVHRDLKPSNVFDTTRENGTQCPKVLDFGISKMVDSGDATLTQAQTVIGSPRYMSPEQLLSSRDVDHRADIWSLGIILYEMLSGERPFNADTAPQMMKEVLQNEPRPMSDWNVALAPGLEAIIRRCLERDPTARYASVGELSDALAPYANPAASQPRAESSTVALATPAYLPPQTGPVLQQRRPRNRWWMLGGAVGIVGAALIVFAATGAGTATETGAATETGTATGTEAGTGTATETREPKPETREPETENREPKPETREPETEAAVAEPVVTPPDAGAPATAVRTTPAKGKRKPTKKPRRKVDKPKETFGDDDVLDPTL
jgi:serine/threonine-protein kinase